MYVCVDISKCNTTGEKQAIGDKNDHKLAQNHFKVSIDYQRL